jgi:hypothetical protein
VTFRGEIEQARGSSRPVGSGRPLSCPKADAPGIDTFGVFILYAIPIGLIAGWLRGGRLDGLADIHFRLAPLAIGALLVQVALFSPLADGLTAGAGRAIYVASTAIVLLVVVANLRLTGVPLVVVGAGSNLAAIVANGGVMPARPEALATVGAGIGAHTNSAIVGHPSLEPLTDIFATPSWVPFANVFSVGDVLIGVGVAVAIVAAMRRSARVLRPD